MKSIRFIAAAAMVCMYLAGSANAGEGTGDTPPSRITETIKAAKKPEPYNGVFGVAPNETFVFVGPENMVMEQRTGWLETALTASAQKQSPRFRHMGWEGDTVFRQNRMQNHGSWKENLDAVDSTAVVVWFGQLEVLDPSIDAEYAKAGAGERMGLPLKDFIRAYMKLLDEFAQRTPRIVIVSPTPFEVPADARVPNHSSLNGAMLVYAHELRLLAEARGCVYVDLFTPLSKRPPDAPKLTRDGMHFTPEGMKVVAALIASELKIAGPSDALEELRKEIVEKNRIWFDTWRCMNWAFAYGDRTTQPFAQASDRFPSFVDDLKRFRPWVENADARIHALALGEQVPARPELEPEPNAPAALSAQEQLKNFTLHPGFSVSLYADEAQGIVKPIQIRWDERGRLWVLCTPSYPQFQPGKKANDYLLMIEDANGKAGKVTRVLEGLNMPMGFEFGDGGIYVCESTQLTHYPMSNDGTTGARHVILSGFGTGDSHQMINSLRWCPDGHLWFTQGYHIWSTIETPHGISQLDRSGLWRFNPRTLKLDGFFEDSSAGLNSWGVTFDEFGQVFHGGGANYCLYFSTPGLIPTLHALPYREDFCKSRGKSMEPEFLHSRHLPDELQGALMKSTYFTSQVSLYKISDSGAGFASTALPDLIASSGNDFRPIESRVGPDGAIYICDWLNPIIGHYQASYRDPRRDKTHGRIWRVTADGRALVQSPALETMNPAQLLEALKASERWTRDQARRLLYGLPKDQVIAAADAFAAALPQDANGEKLLYEISGVYLAHEEPREALVQRLLQSRDFRARSWGVRLLGYWPRLPHALEWLRQGAGDEHPRVRMEACVAASYLGSFAALKAATLVLDKPADYSVTYALTQCIHALAPAFEKEMEAGTLDFEGRTHALVHVLNTLGGKSNVAAIEQLIDAGKVQPAARESLLVALADSGGPAELKYVYDRGAASAPVLEALAEASRVRKMRPNPQPAAPASFPSLNEDLDSAAWHLAAAWQWKSLADEALRIGKDRALKPRVRAAAIAAFASFSEVGAKDELARLALEEPLPVRSAALEALARLDTSSAAILCAKALSTVASPDDAGQLLKRLLAVNGGAEALARAIPEAKLSQPQAAAALEWLARTGHDDAPLLAALNASAGTTLQPREYSAELVAKLLLEAKTGGDAKRGEALFRSPALSCTKCHKVGNEGATIGPELTSVARGLSPELIIEAVLWPKRQVKEGYLLTQLITNDGQRLQGFKNSETPAVLTLRGTDDGKLLTIAKNTIKKRNDAGTIMPDGLVDRLSSEQLADLLRYLQELK